MPSMSMGGLHTYIYFNINFLNIYLKYRLDLIQRSWNNFNNEGTLEDTTIALDCT